MASLLGTEIGPYGYGLMGLTWRPTPASDEQAFAAMKAALNSGSNFWNGGEFYGPPDANSLHILNRYFTKYPEDAEKVVLCIKGGNDLKTLDPHGDEAFVTASVENSLRILDGKKKIDIFECARVDKDVPVEETIRALAKFVKAGKIGGIGMSECSANSIERASKVSPIASVEVELSLWEDCVLSNGVAEICAKLCIPLIAYSPLGRGFLTGQITKPDDIPKEDWRHQYPRFFPENFSRNLELVDELNRIASAKGCSTAQLALAWVKQLERLDGMPNIIPIPGATSEAKVLENMAVVELTSEDLSDIDIVLASFEVSGHRYPDFLRDQLLV